METRSINWLTRPMITLAQTKSTKALNATREHLIRGEIAEAHIQFKSVFAARERIYSEKHTRVREFISPLLQDFLVAVADSPSRQRSIFDDYMNALLEFCIATARYDELEILLQDCECSMQETNAKTPDHVFQEFVRPAQVQLAQLAAPHSHCYWEDSRFYCRTWDEVTMQRVIPDLPAVQALPFAITIYSDRIDYGGAGEMMDLLRDSEILGVLERKRKANDWEILLAWGNQQICPGLEELVDTSVSHKIWVFPADLATCERTATSGASSSSSTNIPHLYRFHHLNTSRSEWMAIRLASTDHKPPASTIPDPNERGPHGYQKGGVPCLKRPSFTDAQYDIKETTNGGIAVTVPFIPWEVFERSPFYQAGLTYRDYMAMIKDTMRDSARDYQHQSRLCREPTQNGLRGWRISSTINDSNSVDSRTGIFGGVPSGRSLFISKEDSASCPLDGKHFVSTMWHDWKHFTIRAVDSEIESKIPLPSGEVIPCLGVIQGNWADEEAFDVRWGIEAYVVDARITDGIGRQCNFVFSGYKLGLDTAYVLPSPELRSASAALSPFMFRYTNPFYALNPDDLIPKTFEKPLPKVDHTGTRDVDILKWEEWNRRDKWNRSYERRTRVCNRQAISDDTKALIREYEREQARRRKS